MKVSHHFAGIQASVRFSTAIDRLPDYYHATTCCSRNRSLVPFPLGSLVAGLMFARQRPEVWFFLTPKHKKLNFSWHVPQGFYFAYEPCPHGFILLNANYLCSQFAPHPFVSNGIALIGEKALAAQLF